MAKIIELLGLPGVGKSTLYGALKATHTIGDSWVPAEVLYPRLRSHGASFRGLLKSVLRRDRPLDQVALREAGSRFAAQNQDFIRVFAAEMYKKSFEYQNCLEYLRKRSGGFNTTLQLAQTLREDSDNRYAILDEGILMYLVGLLMDGKGSGLLSEDNATYQWLKDALDIAPLPEGIIFVDADADIVGQRAFEREKKILNYRGFTQKDIAVASSRLQKNIHGFLDLLRSKEDLFVIDIDGRRDISGNVEELKEALNVERWRRS